MHAARRADLSSHCGVYINDSNPTRHPSQTPLTVGPSFLQTPNAMVDWGISSTPTFGQPRNMRIGAVPGTDSLFAMPRIVNQTPGMKSQHNVNMLFNAGHFTNNAEQELREGQLVFVRNHVVEPQSTGSKRDRAGKTVVQSESPRLCALMNLPMVNLELYDNRNKYDKRTVTQILDQFHLLGTVVSNVIGRTPIDRTTQRGPARNEVVLNVCVRGLYRTFDLWGDVRDGTPVYLRLQKVKRSTIHMGDYRCTNTFGPPPVPEHLGGECWQYVPHTLKRKSELYPNRESDSYDVYVGRIERYIRAQKNEPASVLRSRDLHAMVAAPQVSVFLDG